MKTAVENIWSPLNLLRENVRKLNKYTSARDEFKGTDKKMIFLDANENPYDSGLNRYPDPLQQKVKEELARIKGVSSKNILLGNGSDEVLDLLFRAFCEPKTDNVITLPPTYGMYEVLAGLNDVENRKVLLNQDFEPDTAAIFKSVDENSKILFLCSPNNPTGNSFSEQNIEKLLTNFKGIVVIDEAYIDFAEKKSWLKELQKYPNLVITQTLSKAYGLAGIRLGICYACEEIISILNKIKPPYNINTLTQDAALQVLQNTDKIHLQVSEIKKERTKLIEGLLEVSFVLKVFPSDANFVLVRVDNAEKRYKELLEHGVVTRNRSSQALCENTLRITVGTKEENQKLLEILKKL